jgi:glycosyltransferase involved in cell wall biosynthesis
LNNKPTILCITQLPPPIHGQSLINEKVVNNEVLNLKYDIVVLDAKYSKSIKEIGSGNFKKTFKLVLIIFKLLKLLITRKIKLVYFSIAPIGIPFFRDASLVFLIKFFRIKILYHMHGLGVDKGASKNKLNHLVYNFVFNNSPAIIVSRLVETDLNKVKVKKIYTIANGIKDQASSYKHRISATNFSSEINILFLSNFVANKGVFTFIDVVEILVNKGYNIKATMIGASYDIDVEGITEIAKNRGLTKHINAVGAVFGNEKYTYISNTDIFLFPTKLELFGIVLLENMQFGIPIVASAIGSIPEILDFGNAGLLNENFESADEFSKLVERLIVNKDLRETIAHNARNRFSQYYTDKIFDDKIVAAFEDNL